MISVTLLFENPVIFFRIVVTLFLNQEYTNSIPLAAAAIPRIITINYRAKSVSLIILILRI